MSTFLQLPEHRVIADPKAQTVQEPLGRPSAGRMPQMPDNPSDTRGAPCIWTRNRGDLVRESSTWAIGRQTSPTANREINRNTISMGGIILQSPAPPAVTSA